MPLQNDSGDESSPIKDALYSAINDIGEERMLAGLRDGETEPIDEVIARAGRSVDVTGTKFLGAISHYLFTKALVPTQRPLSEHNAGTAMIVPDIGALLQRPDDALLISIEGSAAGIRKRFERLSSIQPVAENLWGICGERLKSEHPVFCGDGEGFVNVIMSASEFAKSRGCLFRI